MAVKRMARDGSGRFLKPETPSARLDRLFAEAVASEAAKRAAQEQRPTKKGVTKK